ncbi:ABC transporter permease [Gorillibacterium sp. sgz500922]|uniref:ABC transporter permease n=1 Tax=Gorillibacterium sp. sgz500922 TaxID=3446694 RepID=UPI003F67FBE5
MKNIGWVIAKTFRNTFRQKGNWISFFLLPIAGVLLSMILYAGGTGSPLRIGIVDEDGGRPLTADTVQFVKQLRQIKVKELTEAELNKQIAAGDLDAGLILKAGYSDSLYRGNPEGLELRSMKGAQSTAFIKAMLAQYTGNLAAIGQTAGGDRTAFDKLYQGFRTQSFALSVDSVKDTASASAITYQGVGFLIMFMLFSSSNLAQLILEEKEKRTYLRLMSSPLTARAFVLSNVVVSLAILLLQILLSLFIMKTLLGINSGVPYPLLIGMMLLFGLVAIALSQMLVSFAKTSGSLGAMQNLIIVPTCLLAGCFFPISVMPEAVKRVATFMPQHWALDAIDKLQSGKGVASLGMNVLVLAAFALVLGLIAVYRFSRNNDTRSFL